jgi:hypothetical protein
VIVTVCAVEYVPAGGAITGIAVTGVVTLEVSVAKAAVLSKISLEDGSAFAPAEKLTVPEGAPGVPLAVPEADAWANCAVSTVCPEVSTGDGEAVIVPALAAGADTVTLIAGEGVVHTVYVLPALAVKHKLNDAAVPTGDDAKLAGTGTESTF